MGGDWSRWLKIDSIGSICAGWRGVVSFGAGWKLLEAGLRLVEVG